MTPYTASLVRSAELLRAGIQRLDYRLACLDDQLYTSNGQVHDHLTFDEINALLDAQLAVMDKAVRWHNDCNEQLTGDYFAVKDASQQGAA